MTSENENQFILKVKEAVYNDFVDQAQKQQGANDNDDNKEWIHDECLFVFIGIFELVIQW